MTEGITLDTCLDRFTQYAFRYDDGRDCLVGDERKRVEAFQRGEPRPVRSVQTSPWLARIAVTTATAGKVWQLVVALDDPATAYQAYRLPGLIESQAAGQAVYVLPRANALAVGAPNFWLFDDGTAVELDYDADGRPIGERVIRDPLALVQHLRWRRTALVQAVPLNVYLAAHAGVSRVA